MLRLLLLATALTLGTPALSVEDIAQEVPISDINKTQADNLYYQGIEQEESSQFQAAYRSYTQALDIYRNLGLPVDEAYTLYNLGVVARKLGDYPDAIAHYEAALSLFRSLNDQEGEAAVLNNLGIISQLLGDYRQSLTFFEQALTIQRDLENLSGEADTLNNLGIVARQLGNYPEAINYYEQALQIHRSLDNQGGEAYTLNNLGAVWLKLGNYTDATRYFEQSLQIFRTLNHHPGEAATLSNLGSTAEALGNYSEARDYYNQSLTIYRDLGNRQGEADTLYNLGVVAQKLGIYSEATAHLTKALQMFRDLGNREGEGLTLNTLGVVAKDSGDYAEAVTSYQQALQVFREIGNREEEGLTLSNLGYLFSLQNQPELAILFYKHAVNPREAIRQDNQSLDQSLQDSYTAIVAEDYKQLAQLLLNQDRVLEAQRVIDLLKLQELDDYLRNLRGNDRSQQGIELLAVERQLWENFDPNTPDFDLLTWTQRPEITALLGELQRQTQAQQIDLAYLDSLQSFLQPLGQETVLLYPLILEDRLELILITPTGEPIRHTVEITRTELNQTILNFRRAVTDRRLSPKATAQALYDQLLAPLEADLARLNTKTIIYAPDGQLRYIPLASLYDGEQWLIERFGINNITAATLMEFNPNSAPEVRILAAGFADTDTQYQFQIGENPYQFSGLAFAEKEVNSIVSTISQTSAYLDTAFNQNIINDFNQYDIIHLATHAEFVPGYPSESFILFGDGSRATLQELKDWNLTNVDLVVLSACQTATGQVLGNGEELLGLGYQLQRAGANATIATLWSVFDESTQVLMSEFYQQLVTQDNKVGALRQAQISLVNSEAFSHPYYWSPFILIGNGL
jgi:CHAT domain-containing protein/Tfp pilus assembly protein PilF